MSTVLTKADVTAAAVWRLVSNAMVEGQDRVMIGSFGNGVRVETDFTGSKSRVRTALDQYRRSITNEGTHLYEGLLAAVQALWVAGRRNVPWALIAMTDGKQNHSNSRLTPEQVGIEIGHRFNHDPSNFPAIVGVGPKDQIDANALSTIGRYGRFPALALEGFDRLEAFFLQLAFRITAEQVTNRYRVGPVTWDEVRERRALHHTSMDYLFLLDRSGSMRGPAFAAPQQVIPTQVMGLDPLRN